MELALMRMISLGNETELERPSAEAVERFAATGLAGGVTDDATDRRRVRGRLPFDSWETRSVANTRDLPEGLVRRMCLTAKGVTLEVVAERLREGWDFVARVYRADKPVARFLLKVGAKRLLPQAGGFYHWTSKAAPKRLVLVSGQTDVEFNDVAW